MIKEKLLLWFQKQGVSTICLNCKPLLDNHKLNTVTTPAKENLRHRRCNYLGERNLCDWTNNELVICLDYKNLKDIEFCEPFMIRKIQRFRKRNIHKLDLVEN